MDINVKKKTLSNIILWDESQPLLPDYIAKWHTAKSEKCLKFLSIDLVNPHYIWLKKLCKRNTDKEYNRNLAQPKGHCLGLVASMYANSIRWKFHKMYLFMFGAYEGYYMNSEVKQLFFPLKTNIIKTCSLNLAPL